MTDEEFRTDLLAAAAARAEAASIGQREALSAEILERLRDAGEVPDAEACSETHIGQSRRRLEIDAFAFDEADDSLHMFVTVRDGGDAMPAVLVQGDARELGFNRLLGVFEQARSGWLTDNIEESRPLWALAQQIRTAPRPPAALRLHVLSDRPLSERIREIKPETTREGVPITFQIWDVLRLHRIHQASSVRDDLHIDLSGLPGGGLRVLPAVLGDADYKAFLAVVPAETLAEIFLRHGSRLLEGNVRTFLGRRGNVNKGIAGTVQKDPGRFFAYNNGIAATASEVEATEESDGTVTITGITDLQIVNGAQTTASLASLAREGKLPAGQVSVPMKLSVVKADVAEELVPLISRYANSQNAVKASDFFANHPFHRRIEEFSRRIFAPAVGSALTQTQWYYERARGQHLNDQAGLTAARKEQFLRRNPKAQIITKTDLAKVETCFALRPDTACRGAEKAFVSFAERITEEWKVQSKQDGYNEEWFRACVARVILFRAAEGLVTRAPWYENGYRAQVVAYTMARLAALAQHHSGGGTLDWSRIWAAQGPGDILEQQILVIAEAMMGVLRSPPLAGQNVSEWAKNQAAREKALATPVPTVEGFDRMLRGKDDVRSLVREGQAAQKTENGLRAVTEVMDAGAAFWIRMREEVSRAGLASPDEVAALAIACAMPRKIPTDAQAAKLLRLRERIETRGAA